jgi:nucleoid DNA-binding protein
MTKRELVQALAYEVGITLDQATLYVDRVLGIIKRELAEGREVGLKNFGRFSLTHVKERHVKDPRTGEPLTIPPRTSVTFRPSAQLKTRLNRPERPSSRYLIP